MTGCDWSDKDAGEVDDAPVVVVIVDVAVEDDETASDELFISVFFLISFVLGFSFVFALWFISGFFFMKKIK